MEPIKHVKTQKIAKSTKARWSPYDINENFYAEKENFVRFMKEEKF